MAEKYFIGIRTQTNESHSIHKEGCPFMPDDGKKIFLGNFSTPQDAASEGKKHFNKSDSCLFCSKDHHLTESEPAFSNKEVTVSFIKMENLIAPWFSALQCSVN